MSLEVEPTTLPPRSGTIGAQVTDDVLDRVRAALEETRGKPKAAVAIGGAQDKEGTARALVEAVMRRLETQEPPVYVRTHIATIDTDEKNDKGESVKKYRGSISLTPDGKPSRKKRKNGEVPVGAPAQNGEAPAGATAEASAANTTPAKRR